MGSVDMSDMMSNDYNVSRKTWKWTAKLVFHLFDLTIPNAFIMLMWGYTRPKIVS
jgi:hypothetical protein